jgi:transcriptional regulator with XRE-family HTH domain
MYPACKKMLEYRKRKLWTQQQAADSLRLTRLCYQSYEQGRRPTLGTQIAIELLWGIPHILWLGDTDMDRLAEMISADQSPLVAAALRDWPKYPRTLRVSPVSPAGISINKKTPERVTKASGRPKKRINIEIESQKTVVK